MDKQRRKLIQLVQKQPQKHNKVYSRKQARNRHDNSKETKPMKCYVNGKPAKYIEAIKASSETKRHIHIIFGEITKP